MKREEAEQIWGMVAAVFDLHPERSGEQATIWVPALEDMDATIVMTIIEQWMKGNGPEKFPTLIVFANEVRAATRRAFPKRWSDEYECLLCEDNHVVYAGRYTYVDRAGNDQKGVEQAVPCPACPGGKEREFPLEGEGVWGPDGFWQGREWTQVDHLEVALLEDLEGEEAAA
jgi:hypothetical protein